MVRLVPFAPLAPGPYQLQIPGTGDVVRFTVGEGTPATPAPPTFETDFGGACGDITTLSVDATAGFQDADPAQRGLLWLLTTVDGVPTAPDEAAAYDGQTTVGLDADVVGGRLLCASLAFDDLTGARLWETDEVCGEEFIYPDEDDGAVDGCRCTAGGEDSAIGWLAGLVALTRRRR